MKTLDDFAAAALTGLLAKYQDEPEYAAPKAYDYAEAMVVEQAKRTPISQFQQEPSHAAVMNDKLLGSIKSLAGQRVTCTDVFWHAYQSAGNTANLHEVGKTLRSMGYKKTRSGGKDYYQL